MSLPTVPPALASILNAPAAASSGGGPAQVETGSEEGPNFGSGPSPGQLAPEPGRDGMGDDHELPDPPQQFKRPKVVDSTLDSATSSSSSKTKSRKKEAFSLSQLVTLPLDVLTLILAEMDLHTLFVTSRISKQFHSLLYRKVFIGVWTAAWRNSELPKDIRFDRKMSILGYANLLFGDCSVCGRRTNKIDVHLRIKACQRGCWPSLTIHHLNLEESSHGLLPYVASVTPENGRNNKPYYRLEDFDAARRAIEHAAEHSNGVDGPPFDHPNLGSIPCDRLLERLKETVAQQHHEGDLLEAWIHAQKNKRLDQKSQVNQARIADIKRRFAALGFEERHYTQQFYQHKVVRAARPLTENAWGGVRAALEPILEAAKQAHIAADLAPIRATRLAQLQADYTKLKRDVAATKEAGLFPLAVWHNYASLEAVRDLWHPVDAQTTDTSFRDHGHEIAKALNEHKLAMWPMFFDILRHNLAPLERPPSLSPGSRLSARRIHRVYSIDAHDLPDDVKQEFLSSAHALFKCLACQWIDVFPAILSHACLVGVVHGPASLSATAYGAVSPYVSETFEMDLMQHLYPEGPASDATIVWQKTLDAFGKGFSCNVCPPTFDSLAQDWIGMVNHIQRTSHTTKLPLRGSPLWGKSVVLESVEQAREHLVAAHSQAQDARRGIA
ncbi:hypothetical protein JCM10212_004145 [Sporobolomyces blumeae]